MASENPTLNNELPEEYNAEWAHQEIERKRTEVLTGWENQKGEEPKEAGHYQEKINEWQNAPEEEWTYRFFINLAGRLRRETPWQPDEALSAMFKNMPGSDEDRKREIQMWKDLRTAMEKLDLSKSQIQDFKFKHPFTEQETDILRKVYYEMRKLGYSGEDFGVFA